MIFDPTKYLEFGNGVVIGVGRQMDFEMYFEPMNIRIGKNTFINHYTTIRPNVIIGHDADIRSFCTIEDDVTIGHYTRIYQLCNITKGAFIGDNVFIGPGVIMVNTNRIAMFRDFEAVLDAPRIYNGARIGGGATILPGVTIHSNALVGAGSVVTKDVPERAVVYGNPAKFVREVPEEECI